MAKQHNRVPGIRKNGDMQEAPGVPEDIEWDEDNPPTIFACSNHITHISACSGDCESKVLDESSVRSQNLARAFARAGMSFRGVVAGYAPFIPVPGMNVEIFDLECQVQVLTELVCELTNMDRAEFDVKFREFRNVIMEKTLEANEANVRRSRTANALGIIEKKVLGADGRPIN